VLAPEHPLVATLTIEGQRAAVNKYVSEVGGKSDLERTATGADRGKTGVFTGAFALHPITREKVPIWIADYVLAGYGTGAVMAVPAHDERDFAFAEKFALPIVQVVAPAGAAAQEVALPFTSPGVSCNSGEFSALSTDDCKAAIVEKLKSLDAGNEQVTYKLRDWVFSRQRYWGEPIPIYFPVDMNTADGSGSPIDGAPHTIRHDEPIAVSEDELPLRLPAMTDFQPGDDPQGCLARAVDWRYFQKDGRWFARETNTMPQWAGSCWYYLRFTDPKNAERVFGSEGASWLPVDLYVGGQEHAVLHLLYARFWHKVLFDIGVLDHPEPFLKLVHQGMILGTDGEKMSKSRGNVINPDDVVQEYGADALRLYEMFMGPLEAVKPWQTNQLSGVVRFRDRVYSLVSAGAASSKAAAAPEGELLREMHKTIKKVTQDIEKMAFNTAISNLMVFSNTLRDLDGPPPKQTLETLVLLLSPFAPHIAEEAWQLLGHRDGCIAQARWPVYDENLCIDTTAVVAIQVNGKVRGKMEVEKTLSEVDAVSLAKEQPSVIKFIDGMQIKKTIYVPGKILNLVVGK
jgi:leucyl-tRNA synthetase